MEDVFFIIGSSLNVSRQTYDLLKPEAVQLMQFESFDDLNPGSLELYPTFILIEFSDSKEKLINAIKDFKLLLSCESIFLILSDVEISREDQIDFINCGIDGFLKQDEPSRWVLAYLKSMFRLFRRNSTNKFEDKDEKFKLLFETMFSAYALHEIITDENGEAINYRYLEVNPAFEKITGFKAQEVVGKSVLELFPDSNPSLIKKYGDVALKGSKIQFEQYSPDLNKHFEVVAFSPVKGQFATVFIDITEYKEAIKIIQESENSLKEMNEAKDRFFSIVAHDLKSPFSNILGFADLLINDFSSFSEEELIEHIGYIKKATENAYTLLMNLLEWSRVLLNRIDIQAELFSISELVNQEFKILEVQAESKKIILQNEIDIEISVYADKHMIATVLRNLVSNAIKFSDENSTIRISNSEMGRNWQISISDEGIGIAPEKIDRIFSLDKHKSTLGTAKEKGTGLGLILCKEFIEKNRGKIWADSALGVGTNLHFSLPKRSL